MAFPLRLPVVKYSHAASTLPSDASFRWTHVGKPNMFLVFDNVHFGLSAPGLSLKIMLEAETLELVQVENLCRAANSTMLDQRHNQGQQSRSQMHIHAVVRSPRLAMTYRSDGGTMRRFQVRFGNSADFETAVGILQSLKCPVTSSIDRPSTSQGSTHLPTHASQPSARPVTSGSVGAFALPAMPSQRHGIPQPTTTTPSRFTEAFTPVQSTNSETYRTVWNGSSVSYDQPSTSSYFLPPNTSPLSEQQPWPQTFTMSAQGGAEYDNRFSCPSPLTNTPQQQLPPRTTGSIARPSTAPVSSLPESLGQVLPPPQDLPFEITQCQLPYAPATTKQRDASSDPLSMKLPPLPTPTFVRGSLSNASLEQDKGREALLIPTSASAANLSRPLGRLDVNANIHRRPESSKRVSSSAEIENIESIAKRSRGTDEQTAAHEPYYVPDTNFTSSTQAVGSTENRVLHDSDSMKELRNYAKRPDSERQSLIDSMICRYINDDHFLILCEDIENSWRRIGFEKQR